MAGRKGGAVGLRCEDADMSKKEAQNVEVGSGLSMLKLIRTGGGKEDRGLILRCNSRGENEPALGNITAVRKREGMEEGQ